MLEIYMKNAS